MVLLIEKVHIIDVHETNSSEMRSSVLFFQDPFHRQVCNYFLYKIKNKNHVCNKDSNLQRNFLHKLYISLNDQLNKINLKGIIYNMSFSLAINNKCKDVRETKGVYHFRAEES